MRGNFVIIVVWIMAIVFILGLAYALGLWPEFIHDKIDFYKNQSDLIEEIETNQETIIYFYYTGCPYCVEIEKNQVFIDFLEEKNVEKIDLMDLEEDVRNDYNEKYEIKGVPAVVLIGEDLEYETYIGLDKIFDWIEKYEVIN